MLHYSLFLIAFIHSISLISAKDVSIALTMIIRDEEVNLLENLKLWLPVINHFVFLIDKRTIDNSQSVIESTLKSAQYVIVRHTFDGFGSARTASLEAAWKHFPQASHVWIADPDWIPDISTINISELDLVHDVFGFVSYDRTGFTTRTMHWILKNRPGLKMRYNIHEVLDIGEYSWKNLNWTIHEVERIGSWHSTVGHGHSMSTQRFLFDLTLLEKDLNEYGHDSHTHYYLGVTHEAVASSIFKSEGLSVEADRHIKKAIYYLKLRVLSKYNREYVEDRVNCMMLLGTIYGLYYNDFINSEYWYSMCEKYDPKSPDCGVSLVGLYIANGLLEDAYSKLMSLLKLEKSLKLGISNYKIWDCDLPRSAIVVFGNRLLMRTSLTSLNESKYILLLERMIKTNNVCKFEGRIIPNAVMNEIEKLKPEQSDNLCNDSELISYIDFNDIKVHPCLNIREMQIQRALCKDLLVDMPPISEDLQLKSDKSFLGAMSFPDIIHHVFQGNFQYPFALKRQRSDVYRILFAEFFNIKALLRLHGYATRNPSMTFDVIVVTSDSSLEKIYTTSLKSCQTIDTNGLTIQFHFSSLTHYLASILSKDMSDSEKFDYIEYNGGISLSSLSIHGKQSYRNHLRGFRILLGEYGVLGLSYFTKNIHQQNLIELILKQSSNDNNLLSFHVPFINHKEHLIRSYLQFYGMETFAEDSQFMMFYNASVRSQYNSAFNNDKYLEFGESFSKEEINQLLDYFDFKVQSWLPTAFSHPYDELDYKDVLLYRSVGISSDDFTEKLMTSFRYSVYVVSKPSTFPGRATVLSMFRMQDFNTSNYFEQLSKLKDHLKQIVIVDRFGSLGESFRSSSELSTQNIATNFEIGHYSTVNAKLRTISLRHVVPPSIAWILPVLSSSPTIDQLLTLCLEHSTTYDSSRQLSHLHSIISSIMQVLDIFERMNYITFMYKNETLASEISIIRSSTSEDKSSIDYETKDNIDRMRSMGIPESVIQKSIELRKNKKIDKTNSHNQHDKKVNGANDLKSPFIIFESGNSKEYESNTYAESKHNSNHLDALIPDQNERPLIHESNEPKNSENNTLQENIKSPEETVINTLLEKLKLAEEKYKDLLNGRLQNEKIDHSGNKNIKMTSSEDELEAARAKLAAVQRKSLAISDFITKSKSMSNSKSTNIPSNLKLEPSESAESNSKNIVSSSIYDSIKNTMAPKFQSRVELLSSYRSPKILDSKGYCINPTPNDLSPSRYAVTSLKKLEFDQKQLKYILSKDPSPTIESTLHKINNIYNAKKYLTNNILRLDDENEILCVVNRVTHLSEQLIDNYDKVCFTEALLQIAKATSEIDNSDFIVIDVLLPTSTLNLIVKSLLLSTIWFDVTNGQAFASFYNDGLVFPELHTLAKEVAGAFSHGHSKFRVISYYAVAMPLNKAQSPIIAGENKEVLAVYFLHGNDYQCGIDIYEPSLTNSLYSKGVSVNNYIHPVFLSYKGSTLISMLSLAPNSVPETIPWQPNRLVIINSNSVIQLSCNGEVQESNYDLMNETALALFIRLKPV